MNGNNGTPDDNGLVVVQYDPTDYPTLGAIVGADEFSIASANIPKLSITVPVSDAGGGGSPYTNIVASGSGTPSTKTYTDVTGNTTPTPIDNRQRSVVRLRIMKL